MILVIGLLSPFPITAASQQPRTQIVMLGTGTPIPDPERAGQSIAIVVDSVAYLFDAGAGVSRRAVAAGQRGARAFGAQTPTGQPSPRFDRVFLTHLHSDHTLGLADAILTGWIQGRATPLDIYGPRGTKRLVNGIMMAYSDDVAERLAASGGPPANGWRTVVHEVTASETYRDSRVTVTAFSVPHADWKFAFGYRIQTPDGVIVLSGDTRPSPAIAHQCNGCDVLIHEVYSDSGFANLPALRKIYHAHAHTSATQLGDIASRARPKLLILNHQLFFGASEAQLLAEVRSRFTGHVVSSKDLDIYTMRGQNESPDSVITRSVRGIADCNWMRKQREF
ncbi:MAG: MBL fold metallo-hydrolase [Dokdonella sp.]